MTARPRTPPLRVLAGWAAVAVLALALTTAASGGTRTAGGVEIEGEDPPAEQTPRGDQLYTVHCARCHGSDGQGGIAPPLRGLPVATVDLVLRTGRMPPEDDEGRGRGREWTAGEREALVAHLTEIFDLEGGIPVPGEGGDAARGREVFATNCAACHGYTGAGGVAGAGALTPRVTGLDPTLVAEAVRVGPFQMPRFAEEQIDDGGLADIIAFLHEVEREEETALLGLAELNPVYMSAFVAVLALAVALSCAWLAGRVALFSGRGQDGGRTAP